MPSSGRPRFTTLQRERILRKGLESALEEADLRPLLSRVLGSACMLLGADDGGVGLVHENPRRITMEAVHNLPDSEIGTDWLPGNGIAGTVLLHGKPMVVGRYGDIDPMKRPELANNSVLGVPILRRKRMIGFFGIGSREPRKFTRAEVAVLSRYASACAAAIENAQLHEQTRAMLGETRVLYETTDGLSRALTEDQVVSVYLDHVAQQHALRCTVVVYEFDTAGRKTMNRAVGSYEPGRGTVISQESLPHEDDAFDSLLERGETVTVSDARTDKRIPKPLRDLQVKDGNLGLAMIPLISRGLRVGLVTLSRKEARDWEQVELQPFQVTAAHLAAALDIRREQSRLAQQQSEFALVEERKRLARDLHDSVTQSLFAMQLLSQALGADLSGEERGKADRLADLSRASLKEMRALLSELRPVDSTAHPKGPTSLFRARIERHAAEIGLRSTLTVDDARHFGASTEIEHALFRIAQEAVTNAHKHSGASKVEVLVQTDVSHAEVRVSDNGTGFATRSQSGFGMLGIRERAESLGGTVSFESKAGQGTTVSVKIPIVAV